MPKTASKTAFETVDHYIASQPAAARAVLERVRKIIRKAVPGAKESVAYNIAAFKLEGTAVLYFAGWKEHYSLYPATPRVVRTLKKELAPFEVQKGTIRFPLAGTIPTALIEQIAKIRAEETAKRASKTKSEPKAAAKKPAAKKRAAKVAAPKAAAKKAAAKKSAAKVAAPKPVAKKLAAKKASAKKPVAKKPAAKKMAKR
ncbi:Histone protein [Labilithrix luteola]|uniref:Histone protein n=1 Tax=Labilithrix luteola TaxID=1391654 RepID=A0A0K1Q477_9BACT|nr:DUF1801 domain-containing protein [Labilithrix luteola]AKV00534.1 Histone protein [Labilithrix luteola]